MGNNKRKTDNNRANKLKRDVAGRDYFIGVDVGPGANGFSVVVKDTVNGCPVFVPVYKGVRHISETDTAQDRRMVRCARRNTARKKQRKNAVMTVLRKVAKKNNLSAIFKQYLASRKESSLKQEDKQGYHGSAYQGFELLPGETSQTAEINIYSRIRDVLRDGKDMSFAEYAKTLMYLSNNRGHNLFDNLGNSETLTTPESAKKIMNQVAENYPEMCMEFSEENLEKAISVMKNKNMAKSEKAKAINALLFADKSAPGMGKAFVKLICGMNAKLTDLFGNDNPYGTESINVEDDINESEVISSLEGNDFALVCLAKELFDWSILTNFMNGQKTLYEAKCEAYEIHKRQLKELRRLVKQYVPESYNDVFGSRIIKENKKAVNYTSYVRKKGSSCNNKDFCDFIKKTVLNKIPESSEDYALLQEELNSGNYMPRLRDARNTVIPRQLIEPIYEAMVDSLLKKYPCPKEKKYKEEFMRAFSTNIPFFCGPINPDSQYSNIVWKNTADFSKGTPSVFRQNINELIDFTKTRHNFINKLTNNCTYLHAEKVLPKNSLLYEEFCALNILNNLKINGMPISVEAKKDVYNHVSLMDSSVTKTKLKKILVQNGYMDKEDELSGVDNELKTMFSTTRAFTNRFSDLGLSNEEIEDIILDITAFGKSKDFLKEELATKYPRLNADEISKLSMLNLSGWGTLSKKFLTGLQGGSPDSTETSSILSHMWNTNDNLMQTMSKKYTYANAVELLNQCADENQSLYKLLLANKCPCMDYRAIICIVECLRELIAAIGYEPKYIFLESTRSNTPEKKGIRSKSRRDVLMGMIKKYEDFPKWKNLLDSLSDADLRQNKWYLFISQKNTSVYTGKKIVDDTVPFQKNFIEKILKSDSWSIDHIRPRSKVLDNSVHNNMVLVEQTVNQEKDNGMISEAAQSNMSREWQNWLKNGQITNEKYKRLINKKTLSNDEIGGFIEADLVATSRITKSACEIIPQILAYYFGKDNVPKVYPISARLTADFRNKFEFIKVRECNDLHHANDAYIVAVVGYVFTHAFTENPVRFISKKGGLPYNMEKLFIQKDIYAGEERIWKAGENGSIKSVKNGIERNNVVFTNKSERFGGSFSCATHMPAGKGQVPMKTKDARYADIQKYGGFDSEHTAYFLPVKGIIKGKERIAIEFVSVSAAKGINSYADKKAYLMKKFKYTEIADIGPEIPVGSVLRIGSGLFKLAGRSGSSLIFHNMNQAYYTPEQLRLLKKIVNFYEYHKINKNAMVFDNIKITDEEMNELFDMFVEKTKKPCYESAHSLSFATIANSKDLFRDLLPEDKALALYACITAFSCGTSSGTADFSMLGKRGNSVIQKGKYFAEKERVSIQFNSPAGLYCSAWSFWTPC